MQAPKPAFTKPPRKPREEPEGLDAFAAGVPGTVLQLARIERAEGAVHHEIESPAAEADDPLHPPVKERESLGMNVRFTREEKAALVKLATHDQRSQHQIVKRLLGPVLLQAARELSHP